ncbi:MAG: hypothetical protein KDA90_12135 [Planctomycetaceae bacterium]|nr:hypothetical protein [Planctomycetaceae bacterium]
MTASPSSNEGPLVLLITADLMASAQLEGQIRSAGCRVRTIPNVARAHQILAEETCTAIVAELLQEGVDVPDLLESGLPVIVYASHVREAELQAARKAGAMTLSRGQAASQLGMVLKQLAFD